MKINKGRQLPIKKTISRMEIYERKLQVQQTNLLTALAQGSPNASAIANEVRRVTTHLRGYQRDFAVWHARIEEPA